MKMLLAALALAATSIAHAQEPPPPPPDFRSGPPGQRPPGGDFLREFFPPELVMRNQKAIGLTAAQQSAIREEMVRALGSLVKSGTAGEKEILAQFDKLLSVEAEIKRLQIENLLKIRNFLTKEQQEKLKELKRQGRSEKAARPGPPGGS